MRATVIAISLLLLAGCPLEPRVVDLRPDTGHPHTDDSQSAPEISSSTSSVDFGAVAVGEHHEKTLEITNTGDATLSIEQVQILEPDSSFSFEQLELAWIEVDDSASLVMAFEPAAHGFVNATLSIHSDDPSQPTLTVDLNGLGVAPELQVEPSEVLLGRTWIGCSADQRLVLYNAGNEGLLIETVNLESPGEELQLELAELANGPLPWSLGAESTLELGTVAHVPEDEGEDLAFIIVGAGDDRVGEIRIDVSGEGAAFANASDAFTVPTGVVDVVLAVDRSESMDHYLPDVVAALPALATGLAHRSLDLQLAAVVEDDGCVNGESPWIDQQDSVSEIEDALADMITAHGGGSLSERAFDLLQAALGETNTSAGGCNEGLLRDGAALHLVGISDENEQSGVSWSDQVTALQALAREPGLVVFHGVGGDDAGCGDAPFIGFEDAVDFTGGSMVSLCSETLGSDLDGMAGTMSGVVGEPDGAGPYSLSQQPVSASITVRIDEVALTEGWTYDVDNNSVSFDAVHAPSPGAAVEIGYAVRPDDCSQ